MEPVIDCVAGLDNKPQNAMVLLVDDQIVVGEAVRRALADEPEHRFSFLPGRAGSAERCNPDPPPVILQDLVLPGVDGLTLVRAYRANPATRDIPIIVLSSKEDAGSRARRSARAPTTTWSSCRTPSSWWRASATTRVPTWRCSSAT